MKSLLTFARRKKHNDTRNMNQAALQQLTEHGVKPSAQRIAIMHYLMTHFTHPTVEDVYQGLSPDMPTLSRTTVYNTLRLLSEQKAAQMLTIDDHHVCYDGNTAPHVHFICRKCGRVIDLMGEQAPSMAVTREVEGNVVDEAQLYYKGICADCRKQD